MTVCFVDTRPLIDVMYSDIAADDIIAFAGILETSNLINPKVRKVPSASL
jgi:hypothetical protein